MTLRRICDDVDISAALAEVLAAPELWGEHPERTSYADSAHRETQDIWLRFRDERTLTDPAEYDRPHWSVWYPAMERLPSLKPLILDVMRRIDGTHLGGCLMTRIPGGKRVYPHIDTGWHASTMNTKAYLILQANDGCLNMCGDDVAIMRTGSVWTFDNSKLHSVLNNGRSDRIACIVTCRVE